MGVGKSSVEGVFRVQSSLATALNQCCLMVDPTQILGIGSYRAGRAGGGEGCERDQLLGQYLRLKSH